MYLDLNGLKIRFDNAIEVLSEIAEKNPALCLFNLILMFLNIAEGSFKISPQPETIKVNHVGPFLIDTRASTTVINAAVLLPKARKAALLADAGAQTTAENVKLSRGIARISLAYKTIDEEVLIVDAPSIPYHLISINTLKKILGNKILLDLENARVCKVLDE